MYTNRISTTARYNLLTSDIQKNEANFNRLTAQLASGKRINSITDDPIAAVNIVNTNRQLGQIETFNQNIGLGMKELETMDDLLDLAGGYLSTAWDKAVQANNQNYGVSSLKALKTEIDEITKTMVDLANTEFNDSFVFGGANTKLTPFELTDDGDIIYHGTTYDNKDYIRQTEVANGVFEVINTTGDKVFGYYRSEGSVADGIYTDPQTGKRVIASDDGSGNTIYKYENGNLFGRGHDATGLTADPSDPSKYVDANGKKVITDTDSSGNTIYKYEETNNLYISGYEKADLQDGAEEQAEGVMGALKLLSISIQEVIEAKEAGDTAAEQAGYDKMFSTLDRFKSSLDEMTTEQTKFGGVYNRLEMTESTLETNNENLTSYLSQIQDADLAQAISDWYQAQYAYQASLQVAAQSMNMSLLNYI